MKVTAEWQGRRRFSATGPSGYEIAMDATPLYGGDSQGNTPMELLLMGLCGCMGIDVTMILDQMREEIDLLRIEAEGTRREELPTSFTVINLIFHIDGNVSAHKVWRAILLGKKKYCAVSHSLSADITPILILNGEQVDKFSESYD